MDNPLTIVLAILLGTSLATLLYSYRIMMRWRETYEQQKDISERWEHNFNSMSEKAATLERRLNEALRWNTELRNELSQVQQQRDNNAEVYDTKLRETVKAGVALRERIQELETDLENARNESGNLRGVLELERIERENLQGEYESAIREPAMHLAVYVSDTTKDRFGNSRGPVSLMLVMQWSDGPEKWLELRALSYSQANVAKLNKIVDEFNDTLKTQRLTHRETEAAAE